MDTSNLSHYDRTCRADHLVQKVGEEAYEKVAILAGPYMSDMLQSMDAAASFLRHANPNLRRAAIQVLTSHWEISPENAHTRAMVDLAKNDESREVRSEALSWLGIVFGGTDNVEVGELLARTLLDESEKVVTRKCAYDGLCCLRWRMKQTWAMSKFPDAIDWSYVRSFLDTSRSPQPVDIRQSMNQLSTRPISKEERDIDNVIRLLDEGCYDDATRRASELLTTEIDVPVKAFVHMLRAQALIEVGAIQDAVRDLSITVKLDPYRANAYRMRSMAYRMLGNLESAREDGRRADEIGE